jgi:hypothetical protein
MVGLEDLAFVDDWRRFFFDGSVAGLEMTVEKQRIQVTCWDCVFAEVGQGDFVARLCSELERSSRMRPGGGSMAKDPGHVESA